MRRTPRAFSSPSRAALAAISLYALAGCSGKITDNDAFAGGPGTGGASTGSGAAPATSGGSGPGGQTAGKGGAAGGSGNGGSSGSTGGSSAAGGAGGSGGSTAAACTSSTSPGAPVPLRRLTATQVERTVRDVLGIDL